MAKVMIVEDSRQDALLLEAIAKKRGDEAVVLSDGSEAIDRIKQVKPDVVLMDVIMGDRDGFAACRHLKQDAATRGIPVILVSARTSETDMFWGKRNGAIAYVCKPFTPVQINEAIEFALTARRSSSAPWKSWGIDLDKPLGGDPRG